MRSLAKIAGGVLIETACAVAALLSTGPAAASPRVPLPPLPEVPQILCYEQFDEAYEWGMTNRSVIYGDFTLVESWSGLALDRSGTALTPFVVPGVDGSGHTNIPATGALRFWVTPHWSSASISNTAPANYVRLADLTAVSGGQAAVAWSLQISPGGTNVILFGESLSGPTELLRADIAWQEGASHCLVLNFGTNTSLYLDGELVATGAATTAVPSSLAALSLGTSIAGAEPAQAAFDELTIFGRQLSPDEAAFYHGAIGPIAALGPLSPEYDAWRAEWLTHRGSNGSGEGESLLRSGGAGMFETSFLSGCDSTGPLYLTNVACSFVDTNQGWTCSFDVLGGGFMDTLWEVWSTTNLAGGDWAWQTNTTTCSTVTLTNQPRFHTCYILLNADALSHDGYGTPDAWYWLHGLNPLTPGIGTQDSDGDGIPNWREYLRGSDPVRSEGFAVWVGMPSGLGNLP